MPDPVETRARSIYDALDNGSPKLALQTCNKYLKKTPNSSLLKALKALCLVKLGKSDEAQPLCDEAFPSGEEATQQALLHVYAALDQHEKAAMIHEAAFNASPRDESLAGRYFTATARTNDLQKQQQVAMKLTKGFKDRRYLMWTVVTLVLQARKVQEGSPNIFYPLAERMMAKASSEEKCETFEELSLYVTILLDQSKIEEARTLVAGPLGEKCVKREGERLFWTSDLSKQLGRWDDVFRISAKLLKEEGADAWNAWSDAIASLEYLSGGGKESARAELTKLVQSLIASESAADRPKRGPFLGQLALSKLDTESNGHVKCAVDYFDRFASNDSCFDDLRPMFEQMSHEAHTVFFRTVAGDAVEFSQATSSRNHLHSHAVHRQVNLQKLKRVAVGCDAKADTDSLVRLYMTALPAGTDLKETERQHGDDFLVMAAYDLISKYRRTGSLVFCIQAVLILQLGLQKSSFNFQFKLLLIRLYSVLGLFSQAFSTFGSLSIRNIQVDTLSYTLTECLDTTCRPDDALPLLKKSLHVYKASEKETYEMICRSYTFGTYSKVLEFMDFGERVQASLQRAVHNRQIFRLELIQRSGQLDQLVEFVLGSNPNAGAVLPVSYTDNRDYSVFNSWSSSQKSTEELTRVLPRKRSRWVRIYSQVAAILLAFAKPDAEVDRPTLEDLSAVLAEEESVTEHELTGCEAASVHALVRLASGALEGESAASNPSHTARPSQLSVLDNVELEPALTKWSGLQFDDSGLADGVVTAVFLHETTVHLELVNYLGLIARWLSFHKRPHVSGDLKERASMLRASAKARLKIVQETLQRLSGADIRKDFGASEVLEVLQEEAHLHLYSSLLSSARSQWEQAIARLWNAAT